jgi:hypothetical protein
MSNSLRGHSEPHPDDESSDEDGASFAWEFANDEHMGQSPATSPRVVGGGKSQPRTRGRDDRGIIIDGQPSQENTRAQSTRNTHSAKARQPAPTALPKSGRFAPGRANYIRDQLDRALDRWWAVGELPPLALLRDGLLMLEAGASVSESQRTLLLRTALAYDRGVQTALHHQVDAERVALVLAEALLEWEAPLDPERLPGILAGDEQVQQLLVAELERSQVLLTGEARARAQVALVLLPRPTSPKRKPVAVPPLPSMSTSTADRGGRLSRQLLLVLLLVALVGFVLWQRRLTTPTGMVAMPAAEYALIPADKSAPMNSVRLDAFFIDRFEVTNRDYRACIESGQCLWPVHTNSTTRTDYFTNPAFNEYPVVNVTQAMAAAYCAWQDKRLPTVDEWQVAASVSSQTGQPFRYPWGENFEAQRVNSAATRLGDSVVVGSFRPGGDSPSGASDMAGNVAEWTATLVVGSVGPVRAIVKGGSFASDMDAVAVGAEMQVEVNSALPQLGFRCARTHLLTRT